MEKLTVAKLPCDVWQFNEDDYVDAYLILGQHSALLVDALMSRRGLLPAIREITDLPVTAVFTHGHGDHAGKEIESLRAAGIPLWLSEKDFFFFEKSDKDPKEWFHPLRAGQTFDLGGRILETLPIPGHSAGSMAFLDRENQLLFSGDGLGSGMIWMQLPICLSLEELLEGIRDIRRATDGLNDLKIYPGHRNQSPVQLTGQYIDDVRVCTEKILSGELVGKPFEAPASVAMRMPEDTLETSYGAMLSFVYSPRQMRRSV